LILATKVNLALLAPLIVLSLILLVVSLVDLVRREHVTGGNKWLWLAVIILLGTIGQIVYLVLGRQDA
jgi:phospholipase D-like protein